MIHHGGWCPGCPSHITLDGDLPPGELCSQPRCKSLSLWNWCLSGIGSCWQTGQLHVSTTVMTYNTYDLQLFQSDFLLVWTWSRHHWLRQHPSIDFSGGFHGRGPYSTPFFRHRQAIPSKHDNPANITSIRSDCCPKNELPCFIMMPRFGFQPFAHKGFLLLEPPTCESGAAAVSMRGPPNQVIGIVER